MNRLASRRCPAVSVNGERFSPVLCGTGWDGWSRPEGPSPGHEFDRRGSGLGTGDGVDDVSGVAAVAVRGAARCSAGRAATPARHRRLAVDALDSEVFLVLAAPPVDDLRVCAEASGDLRQLCERLLG